LVTKLLSYIFVHSHQVNVFCTSYHVVTDLEPTCPIQWVSRCIIPGS